MRNTGYGLRVGVAIVHAFAGLALLALGLALRASLALGDAYVPKVLAVYGVGTALCLVFVRAHHPFGRYGPANTVTTIRGALVALIAGLIGEPYSAPIARLAALLAVGVAVLDGVDGKLARSTGLKSAFGARYDMETDSVLVLALTILAWQHGKAGVWVLAIGLMRYAFVAAGKLLPWLNGPLTPTLRGKTVAVVQMGALAFVLVPFVPARLSIPVAAVALALLVWSFAIDIGRLWRARARG